MAFKNITEHFTLDEIACKGIRASCNECKGLPITSLLYFHMDRLELLRTELGYPLIITSGHRCESHNAYCSGASNSMHLHLATDVRAPAHDNWVDTMDRVHGLAMAMGFGGIGLYDTFIHLDSRNHLNRGVARWNNRT